MRYSTENFSLHLKEARIRKGLSQKQLSEKSGIPQSHISKIERNLVDLHLSSFIELCRTLELELMMVPTPLITTFKSLIRAYENNLKETRPLYQLDLDDSDEDKA